MATHMFNVGLTTLLPYVLATNQKHISQEEVVKYRRTAGAKVCT